MRLEDVKIGQQFRISKKERTALGDIIFTIRSRDHKGAEIWAAGQEYRSFWYNDTEVELVNDTIEKSTKEIQVENRQDTVMDKWKTAPPEVDDIFTAAMDIQAKEQEEYYKATGYYTPRQRQAAEEAYKASQEVAIEWIKKWDGSTNSTMGKILSDKFQEMNQKQHGPPIEISLQQTYEQYMNDPTPRLQEKVEEMIQHARNEIAGTDAVYKDEITDIEGVKILDIGKEFGRIVTYDPNRITPEDSKKIEEWAEQELQKVKDSEQEKQSFIDTLLHNASMTHISEEGEARRIVPHSEEWDKIQDKIDGKDINGKHLWEKMSSANMTGEEIRTAIEAEIHRLKNVGINSDQEDKSPMEEYIDAIAERRMIKELEDKLKEPVEQPIVYTSLEEMLQDIKSARKVYNHDSADKELDVVIEKLHNSITAGMYIQQNGTL